MNVPYQIKKGGIDRKEFSPNNLRMFEGSVELSGWWGKVKKWAKKKGRKYACKAIC